MSELLDSLQNRVSNLPDIELHAEAIVHARVSHILDAIHIAVERETVAIDVRVNPIEVA